MEDAVPVDHTEVQALRHRVWDLEQALQLEKQQAAQLRLEADSRGVKMMPEVLATPLGGSGRVGENCLARDESEEVDVNSPWWDRWLSWEERCKLAEEELKDARAEIATLRSELAAAARF